MKEIIIPGYMLRDEERAEVEITMGDKKTRYSYRIESFPISPARSLEPFNKNSREIMAVRAKQLKKAIDSYDKNWELLQIFDSPAETEFVQVLYRKK